MSRYQKLVAEAKARITEISPSESFAQLQDGRAILIDVRDKDEWDDGHIPQAIHLSRGMLEVEIEEQVPDISASIILHCGGGGRSALAAESLQKMGYQNVRSMTGGFKAWRTAGLPTA